MKEGGGGPLVDQHEEYNMEDNRINTAMEIALEPIRYPDGHAKGPGG